MRIRTVLFASWCGLALAAPAHARHETTNVAHKAASVPALNKDVLGAEVLLDRAGASPGVIDGRDGDNFAKALQVFQQANGLPVGQLDQDTVARLSQTSNAPQ